MQTRPRSCCGCATSAKVTNSGIVCVEHIGVGMKFRALLLQQMALWAWTAAATTLLAAGAPERLTLSTFLWFLLGHAAGYVQCLFGHPYRRLGWLFWGWSGLAILPFLAAYSQLTNAWIFAFGAFHGFVDVPLSFV